MTRPVPQILLAVILLLILARCAQVGMLTGGKKDITPPKLLEAIPANKSTGFNTDEILLRFDEFVQVKDLSNQLIISPKLKTTPDITASGKIIHIELKKEELLPNTTYRFYFGSAIADMNESNGIQNFEYVFSTGSFIDSLNIKGTVTDAFNNKPVGKVVVGLYNVATVTDSTPYKEPPDYISRTNDNGSFTFGNLPYGSFKVIALADGNKNNLYDGESERIAFRDSALTLTSDTTISLKLFQEEAVKGFIKKTLQPYYGFTQILLNKKAKVTLTPLKPGLADKISETRVGRQKDTIAFFYRDIKDTLVLAVNNLTFKKKDTVRLVIPKNNTARKHLKSFNTSIQSNSLPLGSALKLSFLNWMDTTRSDVSKLKLTLKQDSLVSEVPATGRWLSITDYEITSRLMEGRNYHLKIDTLAFFDINGFTNDTLSTDFKTQSKAEFGKVTLKLLLNKKQSYIIQLISSADQVVKEQYISFALSSSNAVTLNFTDVPPGTYAAKIIFDNNENKKWDSGNLLAKQQPERVIINSKQLKVLSDWEIEEEIIVKE
jgi:uncharacterized protein (DUF2141 family)